jgi:MinD superfamily P-loop ATPase
VNKFDLNLEMTESLEEEARRREMQVVGRIPFDPVFTEAMIAGQTVIEYGNNSRVAGAVWEIWETIVGSLAIHSRGLRVL